MDEVIRLEGVSKSFGQERAVQDLSFSIRRGEIVGVLGPNGAGKTTTIRLINGVIAGDSGTITVFGRDPQRSGTEVRRRSGVLTESAGLYENMTALENLLFFGRLYGIERPRPRAERLLRDFGLEPHMARKVGGFSTGMKKRLGIAKAFIHEPDLLFLDEPTTGLDPEGARDLLGRIRELNNNGTTVLICTHLLKQVQDLCHRFIFLDRGRLLEQGNLRELEERYLGEVSVRVETDLVVTGAEFRGFPVKEKHSGFVIFQVAGKEDIPNLLRAVLSEASIYSAEIVGRDLETLYFRIRGEEL